MLTKADKQYLEERFVTNEKLDKRFAVFETKMELKFATKDELELAFFKLDHKLDRVIKMLDQEHTILQAKQSNHEDRITRIERHLDLVSELNDK